MERNPCRHLRTVGHLAPCQLLRDLSRLTKRGSLACPRRDELRRSVFKQERRGSQQEMPQASGSASWIATCGFRTIQSSQHSFRDGNPRLPQCPKAAMMTAIVHTRPRPWRGTRQSRSHAWSALAEQKWCTLTSRELRVVKKPAIPSLDRTFDGTKTARFPIMRIRENTALPFGLSLRSPCVLPGFERRRLAQLLSFCEPFAAIGTGVSQC